MDQIEKKILGLKQSGYEIRFPGGSGFSKRSSHASFGALVRKNDKVAEVLVVPYLNSYKKERLLLEEEFSFSEDPAQTLVRELLEETGVLVRHSGITLMKEKILQGEMHKKFCYLVVEFDDSNLRTKSSPLQPEIGTPFWCPIEVVSLHISSKHRWIMEEVKYFARMSEPVLKRVGGSKYLSAPSKKGITFPVKRKPSSDLAYSATG